MNEITTIGLDLAKHVVQVHGVDATGATVLRKQLRRAQLLAFFSRLPRCLAFKDRVRAMGIRDRPISARSPWQNPYVERLIGTSARLAWITS